MAYGYSVFFLILSDSINAQKTRNSNKCIIKNGGQTISIKILFQLDDLEICSYVFSTHKNIKYY